MGRLRRSDFQEFGMSILCIFAWCEKMRNATINSIEHNKTCGKAQQQQHHKQQQQQQQHQKQHLRSNFGSRPGASLVFPGRLALPESETVPHRPFLVLVSHGEQQAHQHHGTPKNKDSCCCGSGNSTCRLEPSCVWQNCQGCPGQHERGLQPPAACPPKMSARRTSTGTVS